MAYPDKTAAPPRLPSAWKSLAVVLPFLVLFWVNLAHHTMFFDEVNAWGISVASPTLSKLFYYVHFEGHPWLWYFILWFPSRLTHDPVAMKWVEAAFGTAILLIIGLFAPFSLKQRALILGSYFLVWEYTVMCRMYSVMLLLVLLYVVRRVRNPSGVLGNCILLGLAGNTDMTGALLSSALLVEYAYSSYFGVLAAQRKAVVKRWIPGLVAYAALIALSVATLWPSKQISWQSSGHLGSQAFNRHHIDYSFGNIVAAPWWPISPKFPHHFWETSVRDARWLYVLIPIVLFGFWKTFRRDRNLLLLMGTTLALGFLFADVVYEGRPRHWGIAFISFVVGLWLQRTAASAEGGRSSPWSAWTYLLLGLSAASGAFAIVGSWIHPFSQARAAAMWVRSSQPADVAITGAPDVSFASLAEEMQRPVFFLECQCFDTFKLFSRDREDFAWTEIPARLNRAMDTLGRNEMLFSLMESFKPEDIEGLRAAGLTAEPVKTFDGADMKSENYYFYRISRAGKTSAQKNPHR